MEKFICVLMTIIILCFFISPVIVSAEAFDGIESVTNATTHSCVYDKETSTINISGTMSYDILIKYKGYSLVVYRILPDQTVADIITDTTIQPVAKSDISIKFQFSIEIRTVEDKFSRYALFLLSPENKLILADSPQYVEVQGENFSKVTEGGYKGIISANIEDVVPDTVIIPIYLDAVVSNIPKGYLYQNSFSRFYFEESYIDEIDAQIKSALNGGANVYLQYLLRPQGFYYGFTDVDISSAQYLMPDVYSDRALVLIDSFTTFITERYETLAGIILGKNIDDADSYNACGIDTAEEYAKAYCVYLAAVSIAARNVVEDIDIIIPFSSAYSLVQDDEVKNYSSIELLEHIMAYFEECYATPMAFKTLIECSDSSVNIEYASNGERNILPTYSLELLNANNLDVYLTALRKLDAKYKSISSEFIYVWEIDEALKASELEFLYAYSYYRLLDQDGLVSFVASFENNSNFDDVKNVIKDIDNENARNVATDILRKIGLASWNEVLDDGFIVDNVISHNSFLGELADITIVNFKGEYTYLDFIDESCLDRWESGRFCESLRTELNYQSGSNVLIADFWQDTDNKGGRYEIYYSYDTPESFAHTPYISFPLVLENPNDEEAIYAVSIIMFGDEDYFELSTTVYANELTEVSFNVGEFGKTNKVNAFKISIKEITGGNDDFSLLLENVKGYSIEHSTEEIEKLIFEDRIKNTNTNESDSNDSSVKIEYGVILGVAFAVISIGIGLFMSLRKETSEK